jgi:hypothetical protein
MGASAASALGLLRSPSVAGNSCHRWQRTGHLKSAPLAYRTLRSRMAFALLRAAEMSENCLPQWVVTSGLRFLAPSSGMP